MWRFAVLVAIALYGCGTPPKAAALPSNAPTASLSSTPTASPESPASLRARPLKLPAVQPNSPCPISPGQDFANPPGHKLPGYGFGPGPVFLSGQIEWHSGEYALILVSPDYAGPVVVRGHQLDGPNGTPLQVGEISDSAGSPGQWRSWGGMVSSPPGCYSLQADGAGFSEVIVFYINFGPPPPA
jgi:hypothetical protein